MGARQAKGDMNMKRHRALRAAAMIALAALFACSEQKPPPAPAVADGAKAQAEAEAKARAEAEAKAKAEAEAKATAGLEAGVEAVVYGLPLVIMDITKAKITNVPKPEAFAAPVNQFANAREFPDASFRDVVRANVDTLYSSAFLDLAQEPIVLSVPDTNGRYYLMPMLDAWTNVFASPGKRTTGTRAGTFLVTGPNWSGEAPRGMTELKSPTNMVWVIGRTQTNGPKDYRAVHGIQDGFKLTPLSAFGKPYTAPEGTVDPGVDMKTAPVDQLKNMTAEQFFTRLAALMKDNPAPATDAAVLAKLAMIGIVPGEKFDLAKLDPDFRRGFERSVQAAIAKLEAASRETGAAVNGWRVPPMNLGNFGDKYGERAVVALVGLGANRPEDAVYPSAFVDGEGKALSGASRYVLHFDKGSEPPVNAFWSVTMYDTDSFFVANRIDRYAVSSWMPFKRNADGSLDLYLQHESPGKDKEQNWLPAPAGDFNVTMRMYWPKDAAPSVLDGSWKPPALRAVQ
jgi:hypothetical protein